MRCYNEIELQYCVNLWVWNEKLDEKKQKYCSILIDRNLKVQDYTPTLILHTPQIKAEKYVSFTLYKICHNMSVIYKVMHTAIKCLKKYVCVGK